MGRHDRAHSERPVSANLGPASTSSTLVKSKIKSRTYSDSQEQQHGDDPPAPGVQAAKLELYRPTAAANGASSLNTSTRLRTSDFYTLHSNSNKSSPLTASKSYSKLSSFTTTYHRAS